MTDDFEDLMDETEADQGDEDSARVFDDVIAIVSESVDNAAAGCGSIARGAVRAIELAARQLDARSWIPELNLDIRDANVTKAEERLDSSIDASNMSPEQKSVTKEIEHAILEGDHRKLAEGLRELDKLRQGAGEQVAKQVEARIAADLSDARLTITFLDGGVAINDGHPWGGEFDKDGNCSFGFRSGLLSEPAVPIDQTDWIEAKKAAYGGATAVSEEVQRKQNEQTARTQLRHMGRNAADRLAGR